MDEATIRRLVAMALGVAVPLLNSKLGLNIDDVGIGAIASVIVSYIVGSNVKHMAEIKSKAAADAVTDAGKAAEVLGGTVAK